MPKIYTPEEIAERKRRRKINRKARYKTENFVTHHTPKLLEEYFHFGHFTKYPLTDSALERLGKEIIHYAKTTPHYRLGFFFIENNISPQVGKEWAMKYPEFGAAWRQAITILSYRREEGALTKKLDARMAIPMIALYDEEFREALRVERELTNPQTTDAVKFLIEHIPSTPIVPAQVCDVPFLEEKQPKDVAMDQFNKTKDNRDPLANALKANY